MVGESAVSSLKELFLRFIVFKIDTVDPLGNHVAIEEIAESTGVENEIERFEVGVHQLTSLATTDVATDDVQHDLLYTECRSRIILASYWSRTYHVIVEKFNCLPGNAPRRWTLLLIQRGILNNKSKDV